MQSLTCPWIFISPTAAKFWVILTHTVSCTYLLAVLQYCRRCAEHVPYCTCKNRAENIPVSHLGLQSASSCIWRMLEWLYTVPVGTRHWFMWQYGAISAQWNMAKQSEAPSITPWERPACCIFDINILSLNNVHSSAGIRLSISLEYEAYLSSGSHIPIEILLSAFVDSENPYPPKRDHKLFIFSMCPPSDQWDLKNHLQRHLALGHIWSLPSCTLSLFFVPAQGDFIISNCLYAIVERARVRHLKSGERVEKSLMWHESRQMLEQAC